MLFDTNSALFRAALVSGTYCGPTYLKGENLIVQWSQLMMRSMYIQAILL